MGKLNFIAIGFILSFGSLKAQTFDLNSDSIEFGEVYTTRNIRFQLSKKELTPEGKKSLDSIAEFLKTHHTFQLEVGVHVNYINPESSRRLTPGRAQVIMNYLIFKGVNPLALKSKGYGDTEPILSQQQISKLENDQAKDYARHINRRVEFKVIRELNEDKIIETNKTEFKSVFAPTNLIKYGRDTLMSRSNIQVIYSRAECTLRGINVSGKTLWRIDISEYGCQLESFLIVNLEEMQKIKGCDVLFQTSDKTLYGIKSKSGRITTVDSAKVYKKRN